MIAFYPGYFIYAWQLATLLSAQSYVINFTRSVFYEDSYQGCKLLAEKCRLGLEILAKFSIGQGSSSFSIRLILLVDSDSYL
jgi:hypothetical protein